MAPPPKFQRTGAAGMGEVRHCVGLESAIGASAEKIPVVAHTRQLSLAASEPSAPRCGIATLGEAIASAGCYCATRVDVGAVEGATTARLGVPIRISDELIDEILKAGVARIAHCRAP